MQIVLIPGRKCLIWFVNSDSTEFGEFVLLTRKITQRRFSVYIDIDKWSKIGDNVFHLTAFRGMKFEDKIENDLNVLFIEKEREKGMEAMLVHARGFAMDYL